MIKKLGMLFVISAPSGAGKTSLCKWVMEHIPNLKFSISSTTRAPRIGEKDGVDYHFVDKTTFERDIEAGDFLEWAEVHDHYYGTSRKLIHNWQTRGYDVLLDIDTQGALILKKTNLNACYVFILPPSFDILKERLVARGSNSEEEIQIRLEKAAEEIRHYNHYDYLILNEDFEAAQRNFEAIILAERLKLKGEHLPWVEQRFLAASPE